MKIVKKFSWRPTDDRMYQWRTTVLEIIENVYVAEQKTVI